MLMVIISVRNYYRGQHVPVLTFYLPERQPEILFILNPPLLALF